MPCGLEAAHASGLYGVLQFWCLGLRVYLLHRALGALGHIFLSVPGRGLGLGFRG